MPPGLQQQRILITRPKHKLARFAEQIAEHGGQAIPFATIEIVPHTPQFADGMSHLDYPIVIFISANAVHYAHQAGLLWSKDQQLGAVGSATAEALTEHGYQTSLLSDSDHSSEGLLELPALQNLDDRMVLIVRGVGGRERLARELRERGAEVDYLEVYQRQPPSADPTDLTRCLVDGSCDWITASSGEGLKNLLSMLPESVHDRVLSTPLVVVSERMVKIAQKLGFDGRIEVAEGADNQSVIDAIAKAL